MSIEFVIIPINKSFINTAYEIRDKIKTSVKGQTYILVDTDYHLPFNTRINKWNTEDFDTISIDEDYNETASIIVRFCDQNSEPCSYEVDEFIDLLSSFEDEQLNDSNTSDDTHDGGCIIM